MSMLLRCLVGRNKGFFLSDPLLRIDSVKDLL